MFMRSVSKIAIQLLMLMIISQMLLMNMSHFQMKPIPINTVSAVTPCSKITTSQTSASKICENSASVFLNARYPAFELLIDKTTLFFAVIQLFVFDAPIYSIYKPPKIQSLLLQIK